MAEVAVVAVTRDQACRPGASRVLSRVHVRRPSR